MEVREPCGNVAGANGGREKGGNGQKAIYRLLNRDGWEVENATPSALKLRVQMVGTSNECYRGREILLPSFLEED
jgi:hypothetical protein